MKTIFTTIFLAISVIAGAQTISLTEDSNFTSTGVEAFTGNCGILGGEITVQDLNLNGFTLYLKQGTELTINGNLNGSGEIRLCNGRDSFGLFSVCVNGSIQNDTQNTLNTLYCNSLSAPIFDINTDLNVPFVIYNLLGQEVKRGLTGLYMYSDLLKNTVYVVKAEGFKQFKIII
jgi:hypothetical protein